MTNEELHQMMERYNRELLEMKKRSATETNDEKIEEIEETEEIAELPQEEQPPTTATEPVLNNGVVLNNSFVPPSNDSQNAPTTPSGEPENSVGKLKVQVFVSDRAEPIENAVVMIMPSNNEGATPLTFYTDNSGETPVIELATVSASLSQQPEDFSPYSTYDVTTSAGGYFTILNKNLPIFDGQISILPVKMIPLPENYMGNEVIIYDETSSEKQL